MSIVGRALRLKCPSALTRWCRCYIEYDWRECFWDAPSRWSGIRGTSTIRLRVCPPGWRNWADLFLPRVASTWVSSLGALFLKKGLQKKTDMTRGRRARDRESASRRDLSARLKLPIRADASVHIRYTGAKHIWAVQQPASEDAGYAPLYGYLVCVGPLHIHDGAPPTSRTYTLITAGILNTHR